MVAPDLLQVSFLSTFPIYINTITRNYCDFIVRLFQMFDTAPIKVEE